MTTTTTPPTTTTHPTALVLGATGGIGGEMARKLRARGWTVRALHRHAARQAATDRDGLEWRQGDAMSAADVLAAAEGASLIVHAVNPPGYRDWDKVVLPMIDSTIAAAKAHGARVLLPGTVYNYEPPSEGGPAAAAGIPEDAPQAPRTRKGGVRVELERRLEQAAAEDGVRVLIVRAGDFFGPRSGNNWFGQGLVKPGKPVRAISDPGRAGVGHQWAYLPDVAEAMMQLVERGDTLDDFARFHLGGHWDPDGARMTAAIRAAAGDVPVKRFPWLLLVLLAPFVTLFREMKEMRYLWREPVRLDNARLVRVLGAEPHTPWEEAVRASLEGMGCLAPARAPEAPGPAASNEGVRA